MAHAVSALPTPPGAADTLPVKGRWRAAWAQPQHPIYQDETRRWKRARVWGILRRSAWSAPIILALALVFSGCVGTVTANALSTPTEIALATGATFVLLTTTLSGLFNWGLGLAASILAASLIARERETQNWTFLRVTTLSSADIVGGKLAALLRLLIGPAHTVMALRVAALIGGGVTVALIAIWNGTTLSAGLASLPPEMAAVLPASSLLLTASVGLLDLFIWLVYWLIEPYFTILYNSAVGITASTLARSRGFAIGLAFLLHLVLSLAVYAPIQQFAYVVLALGGTLGGSPTSNMLTTLMLFSVQFGLLIVLQAGAAAACLFFSLKRIETMGD